MHSTQGYCMLTRDSSSIRCYSGGPCLTMGNMHQLYICTCNIYASCERPRPPPRANLNRVIHYYRFIKMGLVRSIHRTPTRARFRGLVRSGMSVQGACREVGIPRRTGRDWLTDLDLETHDRRNQERGKRQPAIPKVKLDLIASSLEDNYILRTANYDELIRRFQLNCHRTTLAKALAAPPYNLRRYRADTAPFLSQKAKEARLQFAQQWINYRGWENAIWTDECSFTTTLQRRSRVLRRPGERNRADTTQWRFHSGRISFMV